MIVGGDHGRDPRPLVRVPAPLGAPEMGAHLVDDGLDPAQLDGGEAPGAGREVGLALVVAGPPRRSASATSMPVKSNPPLSEARMPAARHWSGSAPACGSGSGTTTIRMVPSGWRAVIRGRVRWPVPEARTLAPSSRKPPGTGVIRTPSPRWLFQTANRSPARAASAQVRSCGLLA